MKPKIYLAGPDVFLPNYAEIITRKLEICDFYNFEGIAPSDDSFDNLSKIDKALAISEANETLIRSSDYLVANLTPFRGISADVGTVYELGFARALGKPVYGYTKSSASILDRTVRILNIPDNLTKVDQEGCFIEDFGLFDNLMLYGALRENIIVGIPENNGFTKCIQFIRLQILED